MVQTETVVHGRRTTAPTGTSQNRSVAARVVVGGLVAGAVAGMVMAMWTMVAGATFRDFGFFTPMYLIAAPFAGTGEARAALDTAAVEPFYWATGAALIGAAIHMMNSMLLGVVYAALASLARLRAIGGVAVGMIFVIYRAGLCHR